MIRQTARLARQFPDSKSQLPDPRELWLNGVPETSSRGFLRRVDAYGSPYYIPTKRRALATPDPAAKHNFFQISDLLLDLDAQDARTVRPFAEQDEHRLAARWAVSPERAAVSATLDDFKTQIHASRVGALKARLRPISTPQISLHDIFSAALFGAPASATAVTGVPDESGVKPRRGPRREALERICTDNGFPRHALQDDEQLLRWLLLRHGALQAAHKTQKPDPDSRTQLSNTIRRQTSLSGIRHAVFQSISQGTDMGGFSRQNTGRAALTSRIRRACESVLSQAPERRTTVLETLTFIGNLSERMAQRQQSVGSPLCGLALYLSAELGDVEATSQWVQRGFEKSFWSETKIATDVQLALASFSQLLGNQDGLGRLQEARERQHLFRVLTGLDTRGKATAKSLRGVVMCYLGDAGKVMSRTMVSMYESYLMLLAQLGAARLLWSEWRETAPMARKLHNSQGGIAEAVTAIFQKPLCQLIHSSAGSDHGTHPSLGLEECARLDHSSIATHSGSWQSLSTPDVSLDEAVTLLGLPLDEWMEAVKRRRDTASASAEENTAGSPRENSPAPVLAGANLVTSCTEEKTMSSSMEEKTATPSVGEHTAPFHIEEHNLVLCRD